MSILEITVHSQHSGGVTLREYLKDLLVTLFREEEGFSGKRPFGDSGWVYEVSDALVENGFIEENHSHGDLMERIEQAIGLL